MSDPVTNSEVEDVLSSIRRLVSEGKGQSEETSNPEFQFKSAARGSDEPKLVLTEALRVLEPDEAAEDSDEPEATQDDAPLILETEAPEAQPEEQHAEPDAQPETAELEFRHAEGEETPVEQAQGVEEKDVEDKDVYVLGADPSEDADWVFETAQDKSDSNEDRLTFEDDSVPEPEQVQEQAEAETFEAAPEPVEEEVQPDTQERSEIPPDSIEAYEPEEGDAMVSSPPVALSAKIAALEAVVGNRQDEWEPDGLGADAYSGTEGDTMQWDDVAEEETVQEAPMAQDAAPEQPEPAAENVTEITFTHHEDEVEELEVADDADEEPEVQVFAADEDVLDEEALREMVADIVRQELQGTLGERITRNVRKLVRREIHRALASHNLD